jgi:hypothetical protein
MSRVRGAFIRFAFFVPVGKAAGRENLVPVPGVPGGGCCRVVAGAADSAPAGGQDGGGLPVTPADYGMRAR